MFPVNQRTHHVPTNLIDRTGKGCPCVITPYSQTEEHVHGDRHPVMRQYTPMQLVHRAKDQTIKYKYSLKHIHDDMATTSLVLRGSGSSNILMSSVSFECLITTPSGGVRDHITLPVKIKGTNTQGDQVLSYELVEKAYGGKTQLYTAMFAQYNYGLQCAKNRVHGHTPDFDPDSSKHDQYIRHTEQLLVAYLALPEAAQMILEQLKGSIRSKYNEAISVKVYNMALHLDSTKTCCAPCEYALLGMMNDRDGFHFANFDPVGQKRGFIRNFTEAAAKQCEALTITLPTKSPFRVLVTVTATESDADHQRQPHYNVIVLGEESVPDHDILVKSADASSKIYTTMVNQTYDKRKIPTDTNLSDKTVGISGSKSTKGSPATIEKVRSTRELEEKDDLVVIKLGNLFIDE